MKSSLVNLIGYLLLVFSISLLFSLFNLPFVQVSLQFNMNELHGLRFIDEFLFRIILLLFCLPLGWGILKYKRWSFRIYFWYTIYLVISAFLQYCFTPNKQVINVVIINIVVLIVLNRYKDRFS